MTEDWRGDHLIRSLKRIVAEAPMAPVAPAPVAPRKLSRNQCAVPGCSAFLGLHNSAGVCTTHMHHGFYCRCRPCSARQAKTSQPEGATP
jgi:hypothetical protein